MAALASDWLRHFGLLLWNRWTEFNKTWQESRSQRLLPRLCVSGRSGKQDGRPGLWLADTFSTSPLKSLNGIQRNLTRSRIWQHPLQSMCGSGRSEKHDGRPDLWLAETFLTSPLKLLKGIQENLTRSKISMSSTQFVFSGRSVNKYGPLANSSKKVAHCTQVPLVMALILHFWVESVDLLWWLFAFTTITTPVNESRRCTVCTKTGKTTEQFKITLQSGFIPPANKLEGIRLPVHLWTQV